MAHNIVPVETIELTLTEIRLLLDWYEFKTTEYSIDGGDTTEEDDSLRTRLKTVEGRMVRRIRAKMAAVDLGTAAPTRMRMRNIRKGMKDV